MKKYSADLLLLLAAVIWGFAFVAQRAGMEFVGPFTFNAVRFALGGIFLYPVLLIFKRNIVPTQKVTALSWPQKHGAWMLGLLLFAGASLQQVGITTTTAGNAGFITGFYVIIVPVLGIFWGQRTAVTLWIGAIAALAGLYLLSVKGDLTISYGDLIVLVGAFFWAGHVQFTGYLSPKLNVIKLAQYQFLVCSALSFIVAFIFEEITIKGILDAAIPILYGGLLSVGIAYTLQVVAQKNAHPAHSALILSSEAIFAVLGGWWILNEEVTLRTVAGCGLMMAGMLLAKVVGKKSVAPEVQ